MCGGGQSASEKVDLSVGRKIHTHCNVVARE
jgi:hypothetical protein